LSRHVAKILARPASFHKTLTGPAFYRLDKFAIELRGSGMDKAVVTCALNGVLTNPKQHHVPVTPEEMAREAKLRTTRALR
jgi:hypothetical protein